MKCRYKKYIEKCDRYDLYNLKSYIIGLYQCGRIRRKYYDYIRKLISNRFDILFKERDEIDKLLFKRGEKDEYCNRQFQSGFR